MLRCGRVGRGKDFPFGIIRCRGVAVRGGVVHGAERRGCVWHGEDFSLPSSKRVRHGWVRWGMAWRGRAGSGMIGYDEARRGMER